MLKFVSKTVQSEISGVQTSPVRIVCMGTTGGSAVAKTPGPQFKAPMTASASTWASKSARKSSKKPKVSIK
jgi:hypothetical protein